MPTWRRIATDRLKCVVDAALDGREDAHEGVVVAAVVVVGDLREAHERRAGACGNQVLAVGVAAAWRVDGKVALAAKVNTAQGGGGFHHKPFARPTGSGDGRARETEPLQVVVVVGARCRTRRVGAQVSNAATEVIDAAEPKRKTAAAVACQIGRHGRRERHLIDGGIVFG